LVEEDRYGYRVAFVEAFRQRGIYPLDLDTLSVDTLRWQGVDQESVPQQYRNVLEQFKRYADDCLYIKDREKLVDQTRKQQQKLQESLEKMLDKSHDFASSLGINADMKFEVYELRCSSRVSPAGRYVPQIIVGITQSREIQLEGRSKPYLFHGGATLIID